MMLGAMLHDANRHKDAVECFRNVTSLEPGNAAIEPARLAVAGNDVHPAGAAFQRAVAAAQIEPALQRLTVTGETAPFENRLNILLERDRRLDPLRRRGGGEWGRQQPDKQGERAGTP